MEKSEEPKGLAGLATLALCGIEPARRRDRSVEVDGEAAVLASSVDSDAVERGLNGLVEGVGREVFGTSGCNALGAVKPFPGENLDGTVPARGRRVVDEGAFSGGGTKSGKPSWLGDSGMVSLRGVDPPLAGGPHTPPGVVKPSCAWISRALGAFQAQQHRDRQSRAWKLECETNRFENNLPPIS